MSTRARSTVPVADSATQMIDGLAWANHAGAADHGGGLRRLRRLGPEAIFGADAVPRQGGGATVVTLFTFLPSFLFIFLGGRSSSPRTAISVHRAAHRHHRRGGGRHREPGVFFAYHVLWPQGLAGGSMLSALIGPEPATRCFRFKLGVISSWWRARRLPGCWSSWTAACCGLGLNLVGA